jgi:hypothetical protein
LNSRLAVKGIVYITQGIAGFLLVVSAGLYLYFSAFGDILLGSSGIGAAFVSIPVLAVSAFLLIGTLLKFRVWLPAVLGGGAGLMAATGFLVLIFIFYLLASFMGGIAASGGQ